MELLTADSPEVQAFLKAWHENDRTLGAHQANPEVCDKYSPKVAKQKRNFICLDKGGSGHFMLNRGTGMVYSIKGYGVPNYDKPRGHITFLTAFIQECTQQGKEYTHHYWYDLHITWKLEGQLSEFDFLRYGARSPQAKQIIAKTQQQIDGKARVN